MIKQCIRFFLFPLLLLGMTGAFAAPFFETPSSGSSIGDGTLFRWNTNNVPTTTQYYFQIGTTLGGRDLVAIWRGTANTHTVANGSIPANGQTVYVRLFHRDTSSSNWQWIDAQFTASGGSNSGGGSNIAGLTILTRTVIGLSSSNTGGNATCPSTHPIMLSGGCQLGGTSTNGPWTLDDAYITTIPFSPGNEEQRMYRCQYKCSGICNTPDLTIGLVCAK